MADNATGNKTNTTGNTPPNAPTNNAAGNTPPNAPTNNAAGNTPPNAPTNNAAGNTPPNAPTNNAAGNKPANNTVAKSNGNANKKVGNQKGITNKIKNQWGSMVGWLTTQWTQGHYVPLVLMVFGIFFILTNLWPLVKPHFNKLIGVEDTTEVVETTRSSRRTRRDTEEEEEDDEEDE